MGTSISPIITVTTPPQGVAPGPATGLALSSITSAAMTLSWVAPSVGSIPFTYQPLIAPPGGALAPFGQPSGDTSATASSLLPFTTYQFAVSTQNSTDTTVSATISGTTLAIAPSAPTGLAVAAITPSSISLQWVAPTVGTTPFTYQVYSRTPSGSGAFVPYAATTTDVTQTISDLASGTSYDFLVQASNAAGAGAQSSVLANVQTTGGVVGNPPGPATNLTISNLSTASLTLSWTAPTTGDPPFTYQPQRSLSGNPPTWSDTSPGTILTTVNITGLTDNTAYQFQIVTSNASTGISASASVSTTTLSVLPSAPLSLSVLGIPTTVSIGLQWTAPVSGSTPFAYQVQSSLTGAGSFAPAAGSTDQLTQTINGLLPGSGYDFEVAATNLAGIGPQSATLVNAQTAPGSIGSAPSPATALTISNLAPTTLTLSWTAPTSGDLPFSYQVQQAPLGSSSFVDIGSALSDPTTGVANLLPKTGYQFQVVTTNGSGSSTSAGVSVTTPAILPGAPTVLAVVGSPAQVSVDLSWTAPSSGTLPFDYQVLSRTPTGTGSFANAGATTTGTTQTISGLTAGTGYDFVVQATNSAGTGPQSATLVNVVTAPTTASVAPSAPTNLTAGTVTATAIPLSWTTPAVGTPPLSYVVQYKLH